MSEAEFDKFADEYYTSHKAGLSISGEGPEYFSEYKIADIAREWKQYSNQAGRPLKVLDFGAGIGNSVPYVQQHIPGAQLTCLDMSRRSLSVAEKRFPNLAEYVHFGGTNIPFPNDHFDLVYAMCVFHHIEHSDHISILKEIRRIIRPGGSLFIFEHNPYNPLTVRVVNNCPFDENARLIRGGDMKESLLSAGFHRTKLKYRIFFPHLLRSLRPLEGALSRLALGGQYFVRCVK